MYRLRLLALLLPPAVFLTLAVLGQQPEAGGPLEIRPGPARLPADAPASRAHIRAESSLVVIPVEVFTKARNQPILGLEQEHFRLFEDGVEQKIASFAGEDAPVSVGIIVDHSGSMSGSLGVAHAGVAQFLKTANPADQFFLVSFDTRPSLLAAFTNEPGDIQSALLLAKAKGRTALHDAVYLALNQMRKARHERRALLVLSDGADNSSRYTAGEVRNALRETDVQIYTIGIAAYDNGPGVLSTLSEESGGAYFPDVSAGSLIDVCEKIGIQLRNQYVIAYYPTNHDRNGKWRKVQVKLAAPRGLPALVAHHRRGYYAAEQ